MGTEPPSTKEAVILCAGLGKRLRPLTEQIPKALIEVQGRSLLEHQLDALGHHGVRRVVLVVGHLSDEIRARVGSGEQFHLAADYVTQSALLGTGDALRTARDSIHADPFLVLYGDVYFGPSTTVIGDLLASNEPSIVAAEVSDAGRFGRLRTRSIGRSSWLEGIEEKDGRQSPGLVNAGAYLLPGRIWAILSALPLSPRGEVELTDGIVRLLREGVTVRVVRTAVWSDVGTPEELQRVQMY